MITVREIINQPLYENFRLVSGEKGLSNPVEGTGILEWEAEHDIELTFIKNLFVVTTLSVLKDNQSAAESRVKKLIQKKVAAIAIKELYYDSLSEDIFAYSNEENVPIFFFSEVFIDDVLFNVRSAVLQDSRSKEASEDIRAMLLGKDLSPQQLKTHMKNVNPYFFKEATICSYISLGTSPTHLNDDLLISYTNLAKVALQYAKESAENGIMEAIKDKITYSLMPYGRGVFFILSSEKDDLLTDRLIELIIETSYHLNSAYHIGIGNYHDDLMELPMALREAISANTSAILDKEKYTYYKNSGIDQWLFPECCGGFHMLFYSTIIEKLSSSLKLDHLDDVIATLEAYIESGGNVTLTAKVTYQHANTIRYRLAKVREILNLEKDIKFSSTIYSFIRLHRGLTYLKPLLTE